MALVIHDLLKIKGSIICSDLLNDKDDEQV